jgi:adenylate cyclase
VQIHADLANSVLTGFLPVRDNDLVPWEALASLAGGVMIALLATRFRPPVIVIGGLGLMVVGIAATFAIFRLSALLIDGLSISLALGFVLLVTSYVQFAYVRRAESTARQRFSQYLPQSVVARYLDNPDIGRFRGEERQVTALFTDIEGFSVLAKRVGPRELIALLDVYYGEVTRLINERGGMIDKIVGDAVHAMFNAPEDLDDHVNTAIECALEIVSLTEGMRRRPEFAAVSFGRTRIGIETGVAVLGEVGAGGKLDYTAHGDAINLAARLQDANKFLGTAICIGPQAASECRLPLDDLGSHEIRGFGTMRLFTPKGMEKTV